MPKLPFYRGGRGGAAAVTPKNASAQMVKRVKRRVLALGTSTVTTTTYIVGATEFGLKVIAINFFGQAAVTATGLTAEVFARTTAGATGNTLQSAATALHTAFDTAAHAKAGVAAALTATAANLTLLAGQLLEVTITASSATAGPGDLLVQIVAVPVEDSLTAVGLVTVGSDL